MAPKYPASPWKANLLLLGAGCLLAAVLGELLLRLTGLGSSSPMIPYGRLPFKRRPAHEFVNRKEIVNRVRLNNWGFHDRDREKTGEAYRILALGDSFVEGLQVQVDELFTSRIETSLIAAGFDSEVLNAGVGGVGTAYEYLLYEDFFRDRIEVDHVLLFFFNGNDLPNNHPVLEHRINGNEIGGKVYLDTSGRVYVREHRRSLRQRALALTDRHSALSYTLHTALYRLKRGAVDERVDELTPGETSELGIDRAWREAAEGTLALIERWHEELRGRRIRFSVVVLPGPDHLFRPPYGSNPYKAGFVEDLKQLGKESVFSVLETDLSDFEPAQIYTFDGSLYGHFLPAGHRIVGDRVAAWLKEVLSNG